MEFKFNLYSIYVYLYINYILFHELISMIKPQELNVINFCIFSYNSLYLIYRIIIVILISFFINIAIDNLHVSFENKYIDVDMTQINTENSFKLVLY